jgi:hypothetical protein
MLDRLRRDPPADLDEQRLALLAPGLRLDLDEFVVFEARVDFLEHGVCEPFVADKHHWMQTMSART